MEFRMIDEELRIASCCIADLTMEQVAHFLKNWDEGTSIGTLTMFYDDKEDLIVLNRDCSSFRLYCDIACIYLKASEEDKLRIAEIVREGDKESLALLDAVMDFRKNREILRILDEQHIDHEYGINLSLVNAIMNKYGSGGNLSIVLKSFYYGFMQGKRAERARRKTGAKNAADEAYRREVQRHE